MMEDLLAWLQQSEGPLAYTVLGLAAMVEYLVPPFPGDTVALGGVFLAATAGYRPWAVYLALNVGAVIGGMFAYGAGRALEARKERVPAFLRSPRVRRTIAGALIRFERHGAAYLALNRFVPAFRSVFFLAAGMARLPAWKVAGWGFLSAAVWNGLLLGLGWFLGDNIDQLTSWVETYSYAALGLVLLLALVAYFRWRTGRGGEKDLDSD